MKLSRILIASAAVLAVVVAASVAFAYETGHPMWDHLFGKLDTNGDGVISVAEFNQGAFKLFDVDGNGSIEPGECPGARFAHHAMMMKRMGGPEGPGGPGHHVMGGFFIYSADANRDREVTKAEWDAFLDKALGTDGQLSAEELTALLPNPRGGTPPANHVEHMLSFLDRDGNGVVDTADFNAMFTQLDDNNDGTIEADESGHRMPMHMRGPRR